MKSSKVANGEMTLPFLGESYLIRVQLTGLHKAKIQKRIKGVLAHLFSVYHYEDISLSNLVKLGRRGYEAGIRFDW